MDSLKTNDRLINVLFVDNDHTLVDEIKDYLKKSEIERLSGLSFTFVDDARNAMRKLTELNVNLVVVEIVLPLVSGYHLINAIRSFNKDLPIIIYTRIKNPQDLAKMASVQVNNIFLKELMKKEDLIEIIRKKQTSTNIDETVMELNSQIKALHEGEHQQELKLIQCPKCHLILAPEAHFCNNCGTKVFRKTKTILADEGTVKKQEVALPVDPNKTPKRKK